jgi:hypothetical protein
MDDSIILESAIQQFRDYKLLAEKALRNWLKKIFIFSLMMKPTV